MKLTILGSGTFIPILNKRCSSYLIECKDENKTQKNSDKIIFDLGRGATDMLLSLNVEFFDLNNIFISHMHTDHALELAPFISYIIHNPSNKRIKKKYNIYGPIGFKARIEKILEAFDLYNHKNLSLFSFKEVSHGTIITNVKGESNKINWSVEIFRSHHCPKMECISFRLVNNEKIISYSGDSIYSQNLIDTCNNSDISIIEATTSKRCKLDSHMNGEEAGLIATNANTKHLIITHYENEFRKEIEEEVKSTFKGQFTMAEDGKSFEI